MSENSDTADTLAPTTQGSPPRSLDDRSPFAVQRFGRFVVMNPLGRGGMGAVFEAFDPRLDRRVAIKILHRGSESRHIRQLMREAKALARLSHPNVVQVYEVDQLEGQTFIVMELIRGQTLREWMEQEPPVSWQACVEMFVHVGEGLAAAHAQGLVHRDFKPSNAVVDEEGVARVLDFGLARVVEGVSISEDEIVGSPSLHTDASTSEEGMVVGTPAYMPLEQMSGRSVDARSDQFSFCMALFEAVYRQRPYKGRSLLTRMDAIENGRLVEPPAGSSVPSALHRIVVRGLAAQAEQRWPSMEALLAELRSLLAPRHRGLMASSLVVGLTAGGALLGALASAESESPCTGGPAQLEGVWDAAQRSRVREAILATAVPHAAEQWDFVEPRLDTYAQRWVETYTDACEATSVRHEQSSTVMDLRMGCLHRLEMDLSAAVTVLADADAPVVDRAHQVVGGLRPLSRCDDITALQAGTDPPAPEDVPRVAELRRQLAKARAERVAGRYETARRGVEGLEISVAELGYGPLRTEVAYEHGRVLGYLREDEAAEAALREALRLGMRWRQWDEVQQAAKSLLFNVGYRQERAEEGLRYRELAEELAQGKPELGGEAADVLALVLGRMGRYDEARVEHERAIELRRQVGGDDPLKTANARANFAVTLRKTGDYAGAEAELRQVLRIREGALGSRHPSVASTRRSLALVLSRQGDFAGAEAEQREILALQEEVLGPDHLDLAGTRADLAMVLLEQGEVVEAEVEQRRALAAFEDQLRPEHPGIADMRANLTNILSAQGKYAEAEREARWVLGQFERSRGPDHPDALTMRSNLAMYLSDQGKYEEAEAEHRVLLPRLEEALGAEHPHVMAAGVNFAQLLVERGRLDEAEQEYRRVLDRHAGTLPDEHPIVVAARLGYANLLLIRGRPVEALEPAESAWERNGRDDASPVARAETAFVLAQALWSQPVDRARAHALARRSRDEYAQLGEDRQTAQAEVERWLAEHPVP